jgi:hypothetical protein
MRNFILALIDATTMPHPTHLNTACVVDLPFSNEDGLEPERGLESEHQALLGLESAS